MTKPLITIHNLETNEISSREMNDVEFNQWEADKAVVAAQEQEAVKTAEAKAALLEKLGITEAEAQLLLS